jgi:hypothetical protein
MAALKEKGITEKRWLIGALEMSSTAGDLLLRRGLLPADPGEALRVLRKLSELSGLGINDMIVTMDQLEEAA